MQINECYKMQIEIVKELKEYFPGINAQTSTTIQQISQAIVKSNS